MQYDELYEPCLFRRRLRRSGLPMTPVAPARKTLTVQLPVRGSTTGIRERGRPSRNKGPRGAMASQKTPRDAGPVGPLT